MANEELMLKVENVSKVYKLGEIGGTTLRDELKRTWAKLRKKEDPTKKIGAKNYNKGEKFKALDNISFEVKKGERIGIIGHNGAGKSTLLKLISRVTGPTDGKIYLNGRVASMLEVGTGFHEELTGRENIYLNGAILGMTKKEVDAKMKDIIEFSEVRQFIDTPVKRYSSGMYVKLAFSVAAHLDSEIMIMDEVLAVGDVAFQNKCLVKMKEVSEEFDRTILYVSHNMNTIRQLCDRVIVLNHGQIVFDGEVEEGIKCYLGNDKDESFPASFDFSTKKRNYNFGKFARITKIDLLNKQYAVYSKNEVLRIAASFDSSQDISNACLFMVVVDSSGNKIGSSISEFFNMSKDASTTVSFSFDLTSLSQGQYRLMFSLASISKEEAIFYFDNPDTGIQIKLTDNYFAGFEWVHRYHGQIQLPPLKKD